MLRPLSEKGRFEAECRALAAADPVLAEFITSVGPCRLIPTPDPFMALVEAIVSQQLSVKAADTIFKRLLALYHPKKKILPRALLATNTLALSRAGLSRQKIEYMRDLAERWETGEIVPRRFRSLSDEEVIAQLIRIKGVGRWTAEMFLIFALNRPDVLPVDDLGLKKAIERAYRLRKLPSPERIRLIAEPWRPYRSIATWYLWKSLNAVPVKSEKELME
ncbi:MAG: DNA-3-methyladenine glycosylase 2 family protein [Nitrospirae bacterium]|nr:DNA-3-methyladenine glycosylase 2 family protein [Candidatus Manganitrophaceae bacterium]